MKFKPSLIVPLLLLIFSIPTHAAGWKARGQIALPAKATALAYSTDGTKIATGFADGSVTVWDVKTGVSLHSLKAHAGEVKIVQFTAQDTRLFTLGADKRARLWSMEDWSEKISIAGVAFSAGVSSDGRWLAGQEAKQAIWLWDLHTGQQLQQLTKEGIGGTRNIYFTADGKYVTTAHSSPLIISLETKQQLSLVAPNDKRTPMKIEMNGNQATFSLGKLQDDDAPTHRVTPSQTGSLVALSRAWYGRDQAAFVDVWDIGVIKRLGRYKPKDGGVLASFSFDNTLLAIDGATNATLWDINKGKQVATVKGDGMILFSPKSLELAMTDGNTLLFYVP